MAAEEPSMFGGRTGGLMTATLVTGGVDGSPAAITPPKFTVTDTRLNNGRRLIVAAAPKGYLGGAESQTRWQAALRVNGMPNRPVRICLCRLPSEIESAG
jgi:hypothetical protein